MKIYHPILSMTLKNPPRPSIQLAQAAETVSYICCLGGLQVGDVILSAWAKFKIEKLS